MVSSDKTSSKGKAIDLQRIRNNQRRCRARQKEYIASLEEKIRRHESINIESEANQKLGQLAMENESLKRLLQSLGLRDDFLKAYENAVQIAPNVARTILNNEDTFQANSSAFGSLILEDIQQSTQVTECEVEAHAVGPIDADIVVSREDFQDSSIIYAQLPLELYDFETAPTSASESLQANVQSESFDASSIDQLTMEAFSKADNTEAVSDTTTLCSWAFQLIHKNNWKGYSAATLDLKLRVGYRHGAKPTEGCRIDNKTLLQVLAEVS